MVRLDKMWFGHAGERRQIDDVMRERLLIFQDAIHTRILHMWHKFTNKCHPKKLNLSLSLYHISNVCGSRSFFRRKSFYVVKIKNVKSWFLFFG